MERWFGMDYFFIAQWTWRYYFIKKLTPILYDRTFITFYSKYFAYSGIVNWILTRPIFQVGGKLSYCMYLLHINVIGYILLTIRTRLYFSDYNQVLLINNFFHYKLKNKHFQYFLVLFVVWSFNNNDNTIFHMDIGF